MIHKTAIIEKGAKIAPDVSIGAYSVIGPNVSIGAGSIIAPHVVINGDTTIGENNQIFQFASVGEVSQDKKYAGEATKLIIGDDNVIRESATIHRGTVQGGGITAIGNNNLFMAYAHIAHDCQIGDHNIFVNSASLAGHVTVNDYVIISAFCAIHQFCHVGSHAFISHASLITKDVPPYVMIIGASSPTACGINAEGLKRRAFSTDDIQALKRAYKIIYRQGLLTAEAVIKLRELAKECAAVALFADFLANSQRGILR